MYDRGEQEHCASCGEGMVRVFVCGELDGFVCAKCEVRYEANEEGKPKAEALSLKLDGVEYLI